MNSRSSNFPGGQLQQLDGTEYVAETVNSLKELHGKGKPKSELALKERIDSYFEFCGSHNLRPGIEGLSLSLGISRQMFWRWCNGDGCSYEWSEMCNGAKQFIIAFIEAASLSGKLNPATSCFVLKNWAFYKDTVEYEPVKEKKRILTADELPVLIHKMKDDSQSAQDIR